MSDAVLDYGDTGGDKPPLVLLHGFLGTWDSEFGPEIDWLRPHFRVLAPTLRGYGRSEPKPRTFSRDFYRQDAEDVAAWIDGLHLPPVHLAGYSDGGETALVLATLRPDLLRSVAVWGAVGYYSPDLRPIVQSYWPPTWITDDIRARHAPESVERMVLGWINAVKAIIDLGGSISLNEAERITCPLLLMLGRRDPLNPERLGQQFVDRTPQGRLALLDCGHAIHREQPEAFRKILWDYWRSTAS